MSGFLYHVEGAKSPVTTREQILAWGLGYAFDGVPHNSEVPGPGGAGVMLCDPGQLGAFQPVYRPEEQTWKRVPRKFSGTHTVWIGHYKAAPPTAATLARAVQIDGADVELAGQLWQAPLVRTTFADGSSGTTLPTYLSLDDEGNTVRGEVVDEHAWLLERVTPFWDAWLAGWQATPADQSHFTLSLPDSTYADAAAVLAANYRVGPVECDLLKLFRSDGALGAVLKAACDCDMALAFLKKKVASPSAT